MTSFSTYLFVTRNGRQTTAHNQMEICEMATERPKSVVAYSTITFAGEVWFNQSGGLAFCPHSEIQKTQEGVLTHILATLFTASHTATDDTVDLPKKLAQAILSLPEQPERPATLRESEYIRKPITVTAIQWTGDNFDEVREFVHPAKVSKGLETIRVSMWGQRTCYAPLACPAWWIIKSGGTFQTMSDRKFRETHERAGGGDDD